MKFDASKSTPKGKAPASGSKKAGAPRAAPASGRTIGLDTYIDIIGLALLGVAALTILGLLSTQRSTIVSGWLDVVNRLFGWGAYIAPLVLGMVGVYLLVRRFGNRFPTLAPMRLVGVIVAYFAALATLHCAAMIITGQDGATIAAQSRGGGEVGWLVVDLMLRIAGNVGVVFIIILMWALAAVFMARTSVHKLLDDLRTRLVYAFARVPGQPTDDIIEPGRPRSGQIDQPVASEGSDGELVINGLKPRGKGGRPSVSPQPSAASTQGMPPARTIGVPVAPPPARTPDASATPARARKSETNRMPPPRIIGAPVAAAPAMQPSVAQPVAPTPQITSRYEGQHDWALPRTDEILEPGNDATMKEADIRARASKIEETLRAFGVPGRVTEVNRGPTITQFGVEPGFIDMKGGKQVKVKVSRIAGLADDLALALSAPRIRIEAPVPGRAIVGIEVPNGETSLVSLRDVMESEEFDRLERKTRLRLGLGQDVSGRPVVADLTSMPHLLIAGTTGSGKSVCVNAIIVALLCNNSPDDLRFLMIDPKRVELTGYNGIPHLIAPVVVDLEKTTSVLQWVAREMDTRYRTFAKHGARNIVDFNTKVAAEGAAAVNKPLDPDLKKLPYIVVVIDELADLMMMAPDETEKTICRLAQMARATGIHLILATQRPSVDVVTGLIKANFPARIAFTVATTVDSRVILDGPGAEKLLGRGDMLVVTPEQAMPMRAQGCFLSPGEIDRVVRHWRGQLGGKAGRLEHDPVNAAMTAPSMPMKGTLHAEQEPAPPPQPEPSDDLFSSPPTWDEARALSDAAGEVGGASKDDKLFNDAVATVRMQGKASISLLQRRLRIGYTRAARLIEEMEEKGIVGPQVAGQQYREVL